MGRHHGRLAMEKIPLPGASGSGPFGVIRKWATAFQAIYPESDLSFDSVGSAAAQQALWGDIDCVDRRLDALCGSSNEVLGSTVWGIGDATISEDLYAERADLKLQQYPACAGAVVVTHSRDVLTGNLGGAITEEEKSESLNLGFDVLSGIFNGTIQYWDHAEITTQNEGFDLPHEPITVVVRADGSGQSEIFTSALANNVPRWPVEATGKSPAWPLAQLEPLEEHSSSCSSNDLFADTSATTHYNAFGKEGVALGQLRIPYSIGYLEMGYYHELSNFLAQAKLSSGDDISSFRRATDESIRRTMDALAPDLDPVTLDVDLTSSSVDGGYSAAGWAFWYVSQNPDSFESCYQAWLVAKFMEWSYTDPQAASIASGLGWVTPPASVVDIALENIQDIQCRDEKGRAVSAINYVPEPYRVDMNYITDSLRAAAWTLGSIILGASILFVVWVYVWRDSRVVKASQPGFLVMTCVGTITMGSAIFPLGIDDRIASQRGCDIACTSWVWLLPIGFCIVFSALFSKIWRLNMLIRHARSFKRLKVGATDVLGPFVLLLVINISLLIAWTIVDPLRWHRIDDGEFSSYGVCKSDNTAWVYFLVSLVGVNFVALVAAVVEAYKARNVSMEFSESTFIGFAIISLLQALLLGIPFSILAGSNPSARLFTFTGIIFVMSMSLLLLMFVPKIVYASREHKNPTSYSGSRESSTGMRIRMSRDDNVDPEEEPEQANGNCSTASKSLSDTAVAASLVFSAGGSKHVQFKSQQSADSINMAIVTEGTEGASPDSEAGENRIPPRSLDERDKNPLSAAGNVVIGSDKRLHRHQRGDSKSDDEKFLSSELMTPSEASFASSGSNVPMVRVDELHPEIANWYFRTHHQGF